MARKNIEVNNTRPTEKAKANQTEILGNAFDAVIKKDYGNLIAPSPIVTPLNITHLDALLGGGIVSSGPVLISSTPETGKSTVAFQLSKIFQDVYENGIVVYLDIEGSGNVTENTQFRLNRVDSFGLDKSRFKYEPAVLNLLEVFNLLETLIEIKKQAEDKIGKEFYLLVIWDSIASTPSSKTEEVEAPEKMIGHKARQLSFCIDKYNPMLKFNRVTFVGIDQVRANISIDGPYVPKEKSVGIFKDMKAATNIYSLQHNVQQWIFLSKKKDITLADNLDIDGWFMDIYTEKNKLAKSKHWVTCVFDKTYGLDKFWSEYTFLSQQLPGEKKIYGNKKMPFPLLIGTSGAYSQLNVFDPSDSNVNYASPKFYKKDAKKKYQTDEEFRQWFDYAVQISVYYRIIKGLFQVKEAEAVDNIEHDTTNMEVQEHIDENTGEVTYYNTATGEAVESPVQAEQNSNYQFDQPIEDNQQYYEPQEVE